MSEHPSAPLTTLLSTADLQAHVDDPRWVVVDCRFVLSEPAAGRAAFAAGHIPGARYADLETLLSGPRTARSGRHPLPDPQRLATDLGLLGIGPDTQVVAYDDAYGSIASRLWWLLRWMGHDAVAVLDGGLPVWRREGRPLTTEVAPVLPRRFEPRLRPEMIADVTEVEAWAQQPRKLLLDARPEERFEGFVEPFDPVSGHIPGAVNLPYEDNLDFSGRFLDVQELRALYGDLSGHPAPAAIIHMCGSGVTACMNLLAMEHAGLPGSRLYPGSWSEWITNPTHPIERTD